MNNLTQIEKLNNFTKEIKEFLSPAFITTDPYEIEASSGDLSLLPKYHYKFKEEYLATHIVRPATTEEVSKVVKKSLEYSFPITIRAAGTSCFSSSTPTRGGVVIDVRRMNKIHNINVENLSVKVDAGISWIKLIEALLEQGLAPKCYPTSYKSSCVSGFIASSGKAGIGVLKHGTMKDSLISVTLVKSDGSIERITKDAKGELTLDDITRSFGIFGVITEVELSVTTLQTSMAFVGYSFKSIKNASEYYSLLKNQNEISPFFLSLSDKEFEKLSHKTIPSRKFFVFAVYYDESSITSKATAFANENAKKLDGLLVEQWYLSEKWDDIADTELNLSRVCKNPVFQEYWISDNRIQEFYQFYISKIRNHTYRNAFYIMAGSDHHNRIKLFGLSDIANSREFFGIKSIFNDITHETYKKHDNLYTIGVVNTFYFLKFNPKEAEVIKILKEKLDPDNLVNSYRLVKAKMQYWRVSLLFTIAKFFYYFD